MPGLNRIPTRSNNGTPPAHAQGTTDLRKTLLTMRVVRPWPRLPRAVGDAPSLETSKAGSDGALSNLTQLKMSLLTAGELDWMASKVPPNPTQSVIL